MPVGGSLFAGQGISVPLRRRAHGKDRAAEISPTTCDDGFRFGHCRRKAAPQDTREVSCGAEEERDRLTLPPDRVRSRFRGHLGPQPLGERHFPPRLCRCPPVEVSRLFLRCVPQAIQHPARPHSAHDLYSQSQSVKHGGRKKVQILKSDSVCRQRRCCLHVKRAGAWRDFELLQKTSCFLQSNSRATGRSSAETSFGAAGVIRATVSPRAFGNKGALGVSA